METLPRTLRGAPNPLHDGMTVYRGEQPSPTHAIKLPFTNPTAATSSGRVGARVGRGGGYYLKYNQTLSPIPATRAP